MGNVYFSLVYSPGSKLSISFLLSPLTVAAVLVSMREGKLLFPLSI
jgi:hypothetical protein